jgi:hypothetical protein
VEALIVLLIGSWLLLIVGLNALHRSRLLGTSLIAAALAAILVGSIVYETAGIAIWMLGIFAALHGAQLRGSGRRRIGSVVLTAGAAGMVAGLTLLVAA